jgi:hypothetical protein
MLTNRFHFFNEEQPAAWVMGQIDVTARHQAGDRRSPLITGLEQGLWKPV